MDHTCQRCGGDVPYDRGTMIVGGFIEATLCVSCINAWFPFVASHPISERIVKAEVDSEFIKDSAIAGKPSAKAHYHEARRERLAIDREVYALASEFCKPIPKPE